MTSAVSIGLNAISNGSRVDVTTEEMLSVLRTGDGPGSVVRTLFSDCSLETLQRLGAEVGMRNADLRTAYARAKAKHAAANSELDDHAFKAG